MIRVLHVVTIMNRNGLENRIMDIYRHIDRTEIQFDFLTHRLERGQFDDEIELLGGRIYRFPKVSLLSFLNYYHNLKLFFLNHPEYKIVHSHVNTLSTWVLFAAKAENVPVRIAHSRTWGAEKSKTVLFKYFSKLFINYPTTHKFGCSRQAGEWLFGKKGIKPPNYFRVIPNSIEVSKFQFSPTLRNEMRSSLNIKPHETAFVHVGRFTRQKNHSFLLDVFSEINKIVPDSKLFLIGSGPLEKDIDAKIEALGLTNVIKVGQVADVGSYLNAMDGFIFPSLFEGFGTVTIESQCNGLPILASDTIPPETKVTDFQEFESLNNSPLVWAKHILSMMNSMERVDGSALVKKAGYDISDTYSYLQNFYLGAN